MERSYRIINADGITVATFWVRAAAETYLTTLDPTGDKGFEIVVTE